MLTIKLLLVAITLVVLGSFPTEVFGKVNNLQGKELRIVIAERPPTISTLRNASGHVIGYSGVLYYQLLYLSQKLKFTNEIFPSKENTNGVKINGTWNGLIGNVLRDEADLALVAFAISLERYEAVEFCGRIGGADTAILVRYPEPKVSFTAAFDVFSTGIWAGWLISGAGIVAIFIVLTYLGKRLRIGVDETRVWSAGTVAWYLFGSIVSQGNYCPFRQSSLKVLIATWGVVAFVFVNIYNSTLTSYMSVTYQRPTINSFEDLAANPSYKATILTGSIQEIDLLGSSIEALKVVSARIQKCSADCRKFNFNDMITPILDKDNFVSILPDSVGISFLQKYNSERGKCRLAVANAKLSWKPMFFAVQKSFPYKEEINRESLWFIDTGLRDHWYGQYEKKPKECQLNYNSKGVAAKRTSNRIKLEQLYLPFLILFFGYLLAFVQFCREKFILPLKNRVG